MFSSYIDGVIIVKSDNFFCVLCLLLAWNLENCSFDFLLMDEYYVCTTLLSSGLCRPITSVGPEGGSTMKMSLGNDAVWSADAAR